MLLSASIRDAEPIGGYSFPINRVAASITLLPRCRRSAYRAGPSCNAIRSASHASTHGNAIRLSQSDCA